MFRVLATLLATANVANGIDWNGNWANSCQFIGNDLTNSLSTGKECEGLCAATTGCTHYTWTNYNGGTCWMKKNSVSKSDAVPKNDQGAVCGVIVLRINSSITGIVTGAVEGVVTGSVDGVVTGAVDGVVTGTVEGEVTGSGEVSSNVSGVISSGINWNGKNWAASCQFIGNDLSNALTRSKDCGGLCASTPGCTHFTWTNYKGGTCWMKKNSVFKSNAVPKYDQGAVCGIAVSAVGGETSGIKWNKKNWATSCQFIGNDLTNALTRSKDCGGLCASTPGCTHFTWTNYNGGTCWMKKNSVSKSDAVPKYDQGAVCGVAVSAVGGETSGIKWNGKNWATSCQFIGNDLTNALTRSKDCGGLCTSTPGCTHFTWTNYNGGTCWMKKNSVSKSDAVPKYDQGAVCGIAVRRVWEVDTGSAGASGNNWVDSCDFVHNVLANVLTTAEHCVGRCMSTPSCSHHTWTTYNGRICWTKRNSEFIDHFRRPMPYYNQIIINLD